jgi:hypothetical protein
VSGAAIDPDAYDYDGTVLWNCSAPALWDRFMVELVRVLARGCDLSQTTFRKLARVAYAKVACFQVPGLVHVHAIIRLDGANDRALALGVQITAQALCDAITETARHTRVNAGTGTGTMVVLHRGEQLHTRILVGATASWAPSRSRPTSRRTPQVLARRDQRPAPGPSGANAERGVPEQLFQMAAAVLRLSERAGLGEIDKSVHMRGFRVHVVTKSRGYSTTLGELRQARADYRAAQDNQPAQDDDSTPVMASWTYVGSGYLNPGDVLLAAGVEASLRAAREALLDLRQRPPDGQR